MALKDVMHSTEKIKEKPNITLAQKESLQVTVKNVLIGQAY